MDRRTELLINLVNVNNQINALHMEKKEIERKISEWYAELRERAGETGKTAEEILNTMIDNESEG